MVTDINILCLNSRGSNAGKLAIFDKLLRENCCQFICAQDLSSDVSGTTPQRDIMRPAGVFTSFPRVSCANRGLRSGVGVFSRDWSCLVPRSCFRGRTGRVIGVVLLLGSQHVLLVSIYGRPRRDSAEHDLAACEVLADLRAVLDRAFLTYPQAQLIICGDFNVDPSNAKSRSTFVYSLYVQLLQDFRLVDLRLSGDRIPLTFSLLKPTAWLDHILVSSPLAAFCRRRSTAVYIQALLNLTTRACV